ncbi:MAG: SipW-dependent-type signal peptide-containing protein [Dysosmobacter sp.]|nr:SipW-dependent-type signal peptide-containing protein [Dysosmobacter sp.]
MKARKILAMVMALALTAALAVGGTLAYLTSQDTVTNTFTVGKVAITLDEAKVNTAGEPVDENGAKVERLNAPRVAENSYHLLPGHTYTKDPTITVKANSEESYIRVFVSINEQADLDKIFAPDGIDLRTVLTGSSDNWTYAGDKVEDDTRTYELRYKTTVSAGNTDEKLDPVFTAVVIPGEITNDDLATIQDLKITVVAQAIQADGFDTADLAWAAFKAA